MRNARERRKELSRVIGFLVPEFTQTLPGGRTLNGVTSEGFKMIQDGYACGECLAMFDRFTLLCPACKTWREIGAVPQQAPQLWLDHIEERYADIPYEKPAVVNPFDPGSMDAAIASVLKSPDVDTVTTRQLTKKTRRK
jgi:hypothetical protein